MLSSAAIVEMQSVEKVKRNKSDRIGILDVKVRQKAGEIVKERTRDRDSEKNRKERVRARERGVKRYEKEHGKLFESTKHIKSCLHVISYTLHV